MQNIRTIFEVKSGYYSRFFFSSSKFIFRFVVLGIIIIKTRKEHRNDVMKNSSSVSPIMCVRESVQRQYPSNEYVSIIVIGRDMKWAKIQYCKRAPRETNTFQRCGRNACDAKCCARPNQKPFVRKISIFDSEAFRQRPGEKNVG